MLVALQQLINKDCLLYIGAALISALFVAFHDDFLFPSVSETFVLVVALGSGALVVWGCLYLKEEVEAQIERLSAFIAARRAGREVPVEEWEEVLGQSQGHPEVREETQEMVRQTRGQNRGYLEMRDTSVSSDGPSSYGFEYSDDECGDETQEQEHPRSNSSTHLVAPQQDDRTAHSFPRSPVHLPNVRSHRNSLDPFHATREASPRTPRRIGSLLNPNPKWSFFHPSPSSSHSPVPPTPTPIGLPNVGYTPYLHTPLSRLAPSLGMTPHHASGLLGPSPAPKRLMESLGDIRSNTEKRNAVFKKPMKPVTNKEGMFDCTIPKEQEDEGISGLGLDESVGQAGLRRVRKNGGWRYEVAREEGASQGGEEILVDIGGQDEPMRKDKGKAKVADEVPA